MRLRSLPLVIALLLFAAINLCKNQVALTDGSPAKKNVVEGERHSRSLLQATTGIVPSGAGDSSIPIIIADGGESFIYPPMTDKAYRQAAENGADFLLCKVVFSSDFMPFCRPNVNISTSTTAPNLPTPSPTAPQRTQAFKFTSSELQNLRATHLDLGETPIFPVPTAFDGIFSLLQPNDVVNVIRDRMSNSLAKPVGLALELPSPTELVVSVDVGTFSGLVKNVSQSLPVNSQIILVYNDEFTVKTMRKEGNLPPVMRHLLKINGTLPNLAEVKTTVDGLILPVEMVQRSKNVSFFNDPNFPEVYWNATLLVPVLSANLTTFVGGFSIDNWFSLGPAFNTYLGDPVEFYKSLLYGPGTRGLVSGLVTSTITPAAIAAACYQTIPFPQYPAPIVLSGGGSQGRIPSQTNESYVSAVREGVTMLDCNVQVSSDRVLFCFPEFKLDSRTNGAENYPKTQLDGGARVYTWTVTWAQIKVLRVKYPAKGNSKGLRPVTNNTVYPILLTDFFKIAKSGGSRNNIGAYLKLDRPTWILQKANIDKVGLLLNNLQSIGLLDDKFRYNASIPLWIGSFDQCSLMRLKDLTNGTIPLLQKLDDINPNDYCPQTEGNPSPSISWWVSGAGLDNIKTYANGISPNRSLTISVSKTGPAQGFSLPSPPPLVADAQARKLFVVPTSFANDETPGTDPNAMYDALGTPYLLFQYYIDTLNVTTVDSQFVFSEANFFQSTCRSIPPKGFNISRIVPGKYYSEIMPFQSTPSSKGKSATNVVAIVIPTVLVAALLAIAAVLLLVWRQRRRDPFQQGGSVPSYKELMQKLSKEPQVRALENHPSLKIFSDEELRAATDSYAEKNKLGKGASGAVYKGVLPDGSEVAVKRMGHLVMGSDRERHVLSLANEVAIIGTIHNRNVVTLKGYSIENEWLLVYDYMPNGTVQDALFKVGYPVKLNWSQWFNIVLGTAQGLAYLHEECANQIIHRDIKPSNILLDANFNARLADFGIARTTAIEKKHVTTVVVGTVGYLAPEYAASGQLTAKSDVFSFGMVVWVIITKLPVFRPGADGLMLLERVRKMAGKGPDALLTLITSEFGQQYDHDEALKLIHVAMLCVQEKPDLRPTMGEAVQMLLGNMPIPKACITPALIVFPSTVQSQQTERSTGEGTSTWSESTGESRGGYLDSTTLEGR